MAKTDPKPERSKTERGKPRISKSVEAALLELPSPSMERIAKAAQEKKTSIT